MSKSIGNVVDPLAAMEKWGVDGVRFYLMRVGGRWRDDVGRFVLSLAKSILTCLSSDWSEDQVDKHVKEVQSQLGNYFLRITSPKLAARAKEASSFPGSPLHPLNAELKQMAQSLPERIKERMDTLEAGEALNEIMSVLKVVSLIHVPFAVDVIFF
jgi:methionyl-tRNA synthetase